MADEEPELRECLQAVREGDESAGRALVERLYPLVLRIVRGHLPARSSEEDLAQEVFLKLFARLDRYQTRAGIPFEHWVARLAVRTCLDALRAERRRPELRWSDLSPDQVAGLEYLLGSTDAPSEGSPAATRELLERLLGRLSPPDRLVIHLLDLQQKPVKAISEETGWSVTLVKVRAFRARRRLRRLAEAMREPC